MKKVLIAGIVLLSFVACKKEQGSNSATLQATTERHGNGNEDNNPTVPQAVLAAFKAKFGNVSVQEWRLRNDGTWRAHFMNNGIAWEATFTTAGVLVKSEPA